jgi:RNA polymerase sigma-70 factor (ECF subfamily)
MGKNLFEARGVDVWRRTGRLPPEPVAGRPGSGVRRLEPADLDSHRGRLLRAAYALSHSHADAEDLVQETYEHVLRRPRFLRADNDLAYLLRVLRTRWQAMAQSSARTRSSPVAPETLEWVPSHAAEGEEERNIELHLAYEAIGELSQPLRETLVAVDIVGLSYREAARALGTRTGTIMSRLFRARERVAAALEET